MPYSYCDNCGEEAKNWQEKAKCPYCGYEGMDEIEILLCKVEDLELRLDELEGN
jgi:Zn finger protein HypA/HybF involved in hydrogenase expression